MTLISLVYISASTRPMSDQNIENILNSARDFNSEYDITGMLLYRDCFFIQCLEGDDSIVKPIFEKICMDERHKNVMLVSVNEIRHRSFSNWAMGFNKISDEQAQKVPGLNDLLQGRQNMDYFSSHAIKLLESFKDRTLI